MKKRMMVLVLAGFLAGVAFVISCGEGARSIAQEVIKAIEVSFDPAGTDIVATDVQALGVELVTRISTLETKVGGLPASSPDLSGRVTDLEANMSRAQEYLDILMDAVAPAAGACLKKEYALLQSPADWVDIDQQANVTGVVILDLPCTISVRYIKISITRTDDNGQANICEVQVFGPDSPGVNIALNKAVTANSKEDSAYEAVDGNLTSSSRWGSNRSDPGPVSVSVPHWLMVDLGQNYKVNKVVIDLGDYGVAPFTEDYTLLGKRDGN
jgi:hypothetical protein